MELWMVTKYTFDEKPNWEEPLVVSATSALDAARACFRSWKEYEETFSAGRQMPSNRLWAVPLMPMEVPITADSFKDMIDDNDAWDWALVQEVRL